LTFPFGLGKVVIAATGEVAGWRASVAVGRVLGKVYELYWKSKRSPTKRATSERERERRCLSSGVRELSREEIEL
jgi:hypothetical protein